MSAAGGGKAIAAALGANVAIAASKVVGFAVTGSSSLLAEAVHSFAAEARVRAVEPLACQMYLEPDLDRAS